MANLSDDIQCVGSDHDHYQEATCAHHKDHMMHDSVQLDHIVDSHIDYTSDINIILYDLYVKDNEVPVVHSDVSSILTDAFMMIYDDMCKPHDQSVSYPSRNIAVQISLTAELATFKEHVKLDFKQKEIKFFEDFLDMKSLKVKVKDKLIKQDQSLQTVHMLCRPRPNPNELNRVGIGYKNPLFLTRAKQVQPALYNGHEIIKDNHKPTIVHDTEDTLEIAEITRKKMNDKMNDPECMTRKVKISPHDYSKENFLATFTPQKQLTPPEQIFWSNDLMKLKSEALKERTKVSRPIKEFTVYPPNTPATLVPKVLPTKSQVKIYIFTLIQLFSEFDKTCKKRITPTRLTDRERGFEQTKACYFQEVILFFKTPKDNFEGIQKALTKEVKEMKDVFEELEAEVAQYAVDRKRDAIELKNLLIANDNLIAECLSQKVFCVATNSELNVARFTEMCVANTTTEARCLALKAELANLRDTNDHDNQKELINHFSKLKVNHLNLQLKYQNLKDSIGNNPPTPDKDTLDFDFVFVIGKMQASLQGKDNVIRQLKKQLSQLQVTRSDTDRTLRVQTTYSQITKLTDQVTHLQAQNDLFRTENIKSSSITNKATVNPQVSTRDKHAIDVEPIVPRIRNNRDAHLDYLRHLKESVEIICDIVEEAKVALNNELNRLLIFHSLGRRVNSFPNASGSQPKSHVKSNRISPAKDVNKLPVEDQPRTNKSHLRTSNRVASSSHLKRTRKVKQVWKPKQVRQVWKPTCKVLTIIVHQWRPTCQIFNLGKQCPLTRWVPIGKSNCYMDLEKSQSNLIYKIAADLLKNTNFFRAFTASSTIPSIYIQQFWDTILYDKKAGCYRFQLDEQWEKRATLIVIPSIRFTKLIIHHLQRRHRFHPRPDSPLHLPNEEPVIGYLKFSAKGMKREDPPASKPTQPARKPKTTTPKAPSRPSVSILVRSAQPAPTSAPAKPQEKKRKQATETSNKPPKEKKSKHGWVSKKRSRKNVEASKTEEVPTVEPQVTDEDAEYQKVLKESMKDAYALPRGTLPPVVIREPESGKYQPLPEVPGKGKAKVTKEQVAHDLLSLQKHKKTRPTDQYIFQRRVSKPTGSFGHNESPYALLGQSDSEEELKKFVLRAEEGGQDEGSDAGAQAEDQTGSDAGAQAKGQTGSNPDETSEGQARPDPGDAEAKVQSIPSPVVHAGSDHEHMDLDVADVSPQPSMEQLDEWFTATAYPKVKENLKLAIEEHVLLEEPASSSGTLSFLQHLSRDFSFGDQFFSDKPLDADKNAETKVESMVNVTIQQALSLIYLMTSPIIDLTLRPKSPKEHHEVVTDAVDWAMQAPLCNCFRDLSEADIKEILHQRMWESDSYKSHEDHMQLFEAFEKSMNRDSSEELAQDLAKARKKKKKSRESPKTPLGSPSHQPHPPPPPAGPFGASRDPRASGSVQVPPSPPPPSSTNQESPSKGSAAPSPSKTTASAEYQAWMTTDIRLRPSISLTPADLEMDEDIAPEERPATPEPAWSIRSSDVPIPTNNWASALASNYSPPPEDSLLAQTGDMATFINWFYKRRGITELKPQDLEDPTFEIIKVFHPDVIHLQYQMEECHKLLTDSVDDPILRNNVSKPLPLGGLPGQVIIQSDFFFNKDLDYLRYGNKGNRPALSISKMKAT
nr:hypothetical protein [Tanacetum cinerariifolium]